MIKGGEKGSIRAFVAFGAAITLGAEKMGISHPVVRLPSGMPPRKAML